jgi:hypothetical protein
MARGDKSSYSKKQKRQASDIEKSYRSKGTSKTTAERIAWATVNKLSGGAKGKNSVKKSGVNKKLKTK